ncbi:synaptogyrin-4 [Gopherus flavomarginatus]|uniref:synaptogyrin-4 n=1 Tax=Gopherus flavomarginatus TaxID=286002 RepID=UPI0021CC4148|nr:synaptogyrin-4 [Gopherus flavomarginatus]XP_050783529.1 synaptogyrin-4 [Gopherus flavomarginatus]
MRRVSLSPQELSENNVVQFLRQPRTIARILAGLFSLIIFASLVTDGYQNVTTSSQLRCVLNDNWVACSYAITAGVLAFLQSFLFLALDAYDIIISHKVKSVILSLDLTFSIIWSCIWFVGFCFLANQWNRSAHHYLLGSSSASASIAFAFFSIPCWVYLGYRALRGLWAERPISYKQSLDEGTVAMTTLSSVTTTSIPNSMEYHSPIEGRRASSTPFPQTPMGNRLTFLNDN